MKQAILFGSLLVAALIIGGEVETGSIGVAGIICMAWLLFVGIANVIPKKKKTRKCSSESSRDVLTKRVIKHNSFLSQTDLHVKWWG